LEKTRFILQIHERRYSVPVYKIEVARGLKAIAQMMDCTAQTAKKLHNEKQLPLIKEGGQWTLSNVDYLKWRKWLGCE
jgi:hypothetical protein